MTQEEKSLLLQDLCARLPYGVKCKIALYKTAFNILGIVEDKVKLDSPVYDEGDDWWEVTEVKPYLRPISSMTEEEKEEFEELFIGYSISRNRNCVYHAKRGDLSLKIIDWLNAHHFDYHGLIKIGLALEAPNEIYNN